jgi:aspartyl-tRNA synthetase
MAEWQRTHTCGELREGHVGQTVVLNGWVNTYRAYNDQVFVDLRDRYGITQVVFEAEDNKELFAAAQEVRSEWVLSVRGKVRERLPGKHNPKLATGDVEVVAESLRVLNRCPGPPERRFEVLSIPQEDQTLGDPDNLADEELRLQYRYLDLRRPTLQRALALRHRITKVMRDYLDAQGFLEIETPLLGRSTPEGARDYLVPSRVWPGQWYALPQSPQLYKQLLMVAGYDRYFQIARCLRDEDQRADRQPEFTQLDLEMSFVEMDDVFKVVEGLLVEVFRQCLGVNIPLPLPRLSYEDVMLRYGSDKPDLRYALEIVELSDWAGGVDLPPFRDALSAGGRVRGLKVEGAAGRFSRKGLDELGIQAVRAKGRMLAWVKVEPDKVSSSISKALTPELERDLRQRLRAEPGDLLIVVAADSESAVCQSLGTLRQHLGAALKLYTSPWERYAAELEKARQENRPAPFEARPDDFCVAWVVDFPSFIWDADEKRWAANHHPFTAPQDQYLEVLRNLSEADLTRPDSPVARVKAKAYDLVINGYEAAGGSIRIHDPEVQSLVFRVLGMSPEQARQRFGFLLDALKYGAPPHGGIALGLDRLTMILGGTTNIRDVIAFPKNQQARDLMTGAPAPVDPRQLRELGL